MDDRLARDRPAVGNRRRQDAAHEGLWAIGYRSLLSSDRGLVETTKAVTGNWLFLPLIRAPAGTADGHWQAPAERLGAERKRVLALLARHRRLVDLRERRRSRCCEECQGEPWTDSWQ